MSSPDLNPNNSESEPKLSSSSLREDLIITACKFLQNPKVVQSGIAQKRKFLKSKGLTEDEINAAFERIGPVITPQQQQMLMQPHTMVQMPPALYMPHKVTTFEKIRKIVESAALFGGLLYGIYMFFKKIIKPWLFGEKKKKSLEEAVTELNCTMRDSIQEIRTGILHVHDELARFRYPQADSAQMQLENLKTDLNTVKSLLLGRKQFPSVPSSSGGTATIPSWQYSEVQQTDNDAKNDEMETGSGSGASETEIATKNSDSSLEIM